MKTVRFIANILFYLAKAAAVFYFLITSYALVVLLLTLQTSARWILISVDKGSFEIYYPFTRTTFLLGDYNRTYLFTILLFTTGYGVFLWLLSGVFNAFKQQKIFIRRGVSQLSRFYIFNLTVPVMILILFALAGVEINDILVITFLHLVIGVFAFFMAAIFQQGLVLQEEQDLTL